MSSPATTLLGVCVRVEIEVMVLGAPAKSRSLQFDGVIRAVAIHETNNGTIAAYIVENGDSQLILVSGDARVTVLPGQLFPRAT